MNYIFATMVQRQMHSLTCSGPGFYPRHGGWFELSIVRNIVGFLFIAVIPVWKANSGGGLDVLTIRYPAE